MQCKDIPDLPILQFLDRCRDAEGHPVWATWGEGYSMPTVRDAMPSDTPEKLQLAKMSQLMRRGLVVGCDCGCRGDFELSAKGIRVVEFEKEVESEKELQRKLLTS